MKSKRIFLCALIIGINNLINASQLVKTEENDSNDFLYTSVSPPKTRQVLPSERPSLIFRDREAQTASLNTNSENKIGDLYRDIFDHSSDLIAILTNCTFEPLVSNFITRINKKAWKRILRLEEESVIGNSFQHFIHPEDMQHSTDSMIKFNQSIPSQIPFEFKSRYRCKDNSYCWIQWIILRHSEKLLEEKDEIKLLCIGRDITSQKELEDKTKILNAVFEIQSAYITEKEHLERDCLDCSEVSISDDFLKNYKTLEIIVNSFINITESEFGFVGELFYDEYNIPYILQVFSGMNKISNEKNLEIYVKDKYRKEGKKLSCYKNILGEIINIKNSLIINDVKSYDKPTGIPRIHLSISSLLGFPLIVKDKVIGILCLANRKHGYNTDISSWLEPLTILSGRIMNELKMERREVDYQRAARQHAESSNQAKSAFLAHMSHELRTPLTGLLGMIDLINKGNLHGDDLQYLETARESGVILLNIVNDILDISKIESGKLNFESIKFSPVNIIQEVSNILEKEASKKHLKFNLNISPKVPPYLVGDPTRLKQIFFNLIGNAIKFTPKGFVSVHLDGALGAQGNQFCLMGDVTDSGIGISSEVQERLFSPFTQADNKMQRQFGGTGLGLYITKKLCEIMKGDVSVSSEIGKGSKFHFKVHLEQPQGYDSIESPGKTSIDTLPNMRILVVEDNTVSQLVLKTILTRAGCDVSIAWNGEEALRSCQTDHYDIILMDGEMPVMDGVTATKKIRETFNRETLPIIGVTAHAMIEEKDKFLEAGMNSYITKPIQKQILFSEIMKCLQKK